MVGHKHVDTLTHVHSRYLVHTYRLHLWREMIQAIYNTLLYTPTHRNGKHLAIVVSITTVIAEASIAHVAAMWTSRRCAHLGTYYLPTTYYVCTGATCIRICNARFKDPASSNWPHVPTKVERRRKKRWRIMLADNKRTPNAFVTVSLGRSVSRDYWTEGFIYRDFPLPAHQLQLLHLHSTVTTARINSLTNVPPFHTSTLPHFHTSSNKPKSILQGHCPAVKTFSNLLSS